MNDIAEKALEQIHGSGCSSDKVDRISADVRKLFAYIHSQYGGQFISKYSVNQRDELGNDKGLKAAMLTWQGALKKYPAELIRRACDQWALGSPNFPPNLPQIEALCRQLAADSVPASKPLVRIDSVAFEPVEFERKKDGRDWAREILARRAAGQLVRSIQIRYACEALRVAMPKAPARQQS